MYQVLIDGRDLYYPGDEVHTITDTTLELQLNDSGTFEFSITKDNPEYENIQARVSTLQITKDEKEIFCGEVRELETDFYGIKQVYAVGELAFLFDSIQPQAKYQGYTSRQMLETWLNIHNGQVEEKKRFYVGIVTIHDSNDSLYRFTNQETTLDAIREKLCEKLNGYLRIRKVNGRRYLDLVTLQDYGKICEQPIEFGENLLEYAENISVSELYTACIPKGARLEESPIEGLEAYVDIKSVNGGKDYVSIQAAVNTYGWNRCVVSWDDVTEPANLKKKAEEWLKAAQYETMVLNLTAADMSLLDQSIDSFELGDSIPVFSAPHGMDRTFPVQLLELHLQDPAADRLQLGATLQLSYTDQNKGHYQAVEAEIENTRQTTAWLQSAIDNATQMMTGSKGGYKVTEYDEDGKFLRDLYMNAPSKDAATNIMQINMNGIGFSRNGFDGPYKNAWTIDGVLLGEFIKAGSVKAEALSVEYKSSVEKAITSKFEVAEGLITAEVTRAKSAEGSLSSSLNIQAEKIEQRVTKGEFGSYVTQYYDRVIYGFNRNSKYVQINPGEIDIYDNGVVNSKLRSSFDERGNHFWRDGYKVGVIGTNQYHDDDSKKGLDFDLEYDGAYMTWASDDNEGDYTYDMKWTYAKKDIGSYGADMLHAGCDVDMHYNVLKRVHLENIAAGGYAGWDGFIPIITDITDNGDGTISWTPSHITVSGGIVINAPS